MGDFNLEDLLRDLGSEETPEIDWSAPEAGEFPPVVRPGVVDFVFRLREDKPFDSVEIMGGKYLSVIFDAEVITPEGPKTVTYQRVNTYKHEKVAMSSAAELARSIGAIPEENPPRPADWVSAFQNASGRARGKAKVAWRFRDETTDITYSTQPRKRKNQAGEKVKDQPWPRRSDGNFEDTITDSTGRKRYGQAELVQFFSPAGEDAVGRGA